ncbi:hypothetical protein N3930_46880, partial [Bacillus thuringiensis]|nr:hypothetical protein [Bacillus thuringiensis]
SAEDQYHRSAGATHERPQDAAVSETAPPAGGVAPADRLVASDIPLKPRMRGWLHAGMVPLALAAGIVLIALAPSGTLRWA